MFVTAISGKWKVIILCFHLMGLAGSLRYDELEALGVSCPPKDSCLRRMGEIKFSQRTCECQPSCAERGTCCIDSPHANSVPAENKEKCIDIPTRCMYTKGMRAVTKCSSQWNGSQKIIEQCEGDPTKIGNVLMLIPASSPNTGITYLNYFCAICNDDHTDAVLWNVTIYRLYSLIPDDVCQDKNPHKLQYEQDTREWGFMERCFSKSWPVFVPVKIEIGKPPFQLSFCDTGVIESCASDWGSASIKRKCGAYTGVIRIPSKDSGMKYYRNVHCAICNHAKNLTEASCSPFNAGTLGVLCPSPDSDITATLNHGMVHDESCGAGYEGYFNDLGGCRLEICRKGNCTQAPNNGFGFPTISLQ